MSNWKTYRLGDFAEINPRISLKQGNEYSFVEMKDLDATFKYVTPSAKKELKGGAKFENGDTLFARITPCLENGKICQVKELENNIGFGSTEFLIFRGKENISDTDFVYYLMRSDYVRNNAIQMMSGTSGRQRVEKSALEELEIQAPDLNTQKEIAQILSSLDDKIELLQQMNQTLEGIAQAIFKEWFVDFNFPGFDGELEEGLPKGWKECILKDFGKIVCGKTPSKAIDEYFGGEYMFIKIPDMHNTVFVTNTNDTLTQEGVNSQSNKTLPAFSICVSSIATVGLVCINPQPCQTNQQINAIVPMDSYLKYYLYFLVLSMKETFVSTASGGTATLNMNTSQFSNLSAIYPHNDILIEFDEKVSPLMEKILENQYQIQTLTQTRDTLLPKLMSGQLEVV